MKHESVTMIEEEAQIEEEDSKTSDIVKQKSVESTP